MTIPKEALDAAVHSLEQQVSDDQQTSWASDLPDMWPLPKNGKAFTDYGAIDLAQIAETVIEAALPHLLEQLDKLQGKTSDIERKPAARKKCPRACPCPCHEEGLPNPHHGMYCAGKDLPEGWENMPREDVEKIIYRLPEEQPCSCRGEYITAIDLVDGCKCGRLKPFDRMTDDECNAAAAQGDSPTLREVSVYGRGPEES